MTQYDFAGFDNVSAWLARCYDRDALKRAQALS